VEESLKIQRDVGDRRLIARLLCNLGLVGQLQGDLGAARGPCLEGLLLREELQDEQGLARSLENIAQLAAAHGPPELAAWLFGAAARHREELRATLSSNEMPRHEQGLARVASTMTPEAFGDANVAGHGAQTSAAVARARTWLDSLD
jgi:hypothetical protein